MAKSREEFSRRDPKEMLGRSFSPGPDDATSVASVPDRDGDTIVTVALKIPKRLRTAAKIRAAETGITANALYTRAIEEYLTR